MRNLRFLALLGALVGISAGYTLPAAPAPTTPNVLAPSSVSFGRVSASAPPQQAAQLPAPDLLRARPAAAFQGEGQQARAPHHSITGFRLLLPGRVSFCLTSPFMPPAVPAHVQLPAGNL